jgi:hypothetical protein
MVTAEMETVTNNFSKWQSPAFEASLPISIIVVT